MNTVTILIGNTDNKLTQQSWSIFCGRMDDYLQRHYNVHFRGGSSYDSQHQNACWVCEIRDSQIKQIKEIVRMIRSSFNQTSVAFISGTVEFV